MSADSLVASLRPITKGTRVVVVAWADVEKLALLQAQRDELLTLLREHLAWYDGDEPDDERTLIRRTRAAIEKAGGAE